MFDRLEGWLRENYTMDGFQNWAIAILFLAMFLDRAYLLWLWHADRRDKKKEERGDRSDGRRKNGRHAA